MVQVSLMVAWVVAWLVTSDTVNGAESSDPRFPTGLLSMLPVLRPAKSVIRSVKMAAPDLFIDLPERVRSMGYPVEVHKVRTEDGYILTVHRIPRGRDTVNTSGTNIADANFDKETSRPPVLLQHGIIGCSDRWVIGGVGIAPALTLADRGYDVWMNNIRGNDYSKKHETIGRKDARFWKFSWHEVGKYDIPAVIDHVLNTTGQEKMFYIGHSMGNVLFYVAMTMRPEYNAKIRLQVALAPAVFFDEAASAPLRMAVANANYIKALLDNFPTYELSLKTDAIISLYYLVCSDKAYFSKLCAVWYSWNIGVMDLNNTTNLCLQVARGLSSTSALVPWHYVQNLRSGEFRMMDFGKAENLVKYGSEQPPKYPLHKVTAPVALYASDGDFLVPTKGVLRLEKALPNVVSTNIIHETFFNHLDFMFSSESKRIVMEKRVGHNGALLSTLLRHLKNS